MDDPWIDNLVASREKWLERSSFYLCKRTYVIKY
jgi:hypothetical protein